MGRTWKATAVVVTTWSVPLGLTASPPMYRTAATGRKRASTRRRVRAALSIDVSDSVTAGSRPADAARDHAVRVHQQSLTTRTLRVPPAAAICREATVSPASMPLGLASGNTRAGRRSADQPGQLPGV